MQDVHNSAEKYGDCCGAFQEQWLLSSVLCYTEQDGCHAAVEFLLEPVCVMHFVTAKGLLSRNNGMNIYRGCTHGCIYCDARSRCYQMAHAFTDVAVKRNAPELLRRELNRKRARCMIGTGAMSDPYMPEEETLALTRQCLAIIAERGFGLAIQTKSDRILRDLPLLQRINGSARCIVQMTLTTLDDALCRIVEPNVCPTSRRAAVLRMLRDAGIPTIVWLCPLLPFLNDTAENVGGILELCAEAGVRGILSFGMGLTLREGNREYYYAQLDRYFPGLRERYEKTYGFSYLLPSPNAEVLMRLLARFCREHGMLYREDEIFAYLRQFPAAPGGAIRLFDI